MKHKFLTRFIINKIAKLENFTTTVYWPKNKIKPKRKIRFPNLATVTPNDIKTLKNVSKKKRITMIWKYLYSIATYDLKTALIGDCATR